MPSTNNKKSKKKASRTLGNDLTRSKVFLPDAWQRQVAGLNPRIGENGVWFFLDGDYYVRLRDNKNKLPVVAGDCPVCLKNRSTLTCSRCHSVSYCSKECQTKAWKESHKKACSPNPKLYDIKLSLEPLVALPQRYNEPYEFLKIKPTEAMESLEDICENVLESADHIMDIPGFGHNQIQPTWAADNTSHPLHKMICETLGWTSGVYGVELVHGYRLAEDFCVYFALNDDSFSNPQASPGLATNYYGGSIYSSHVREGKAVRGNIIIFKQILKNKKWQPLQGKLEPLSLVFQFMDDSELHFDYELYPITKLEVAVMLQERRKALSEGAYTRRMWRYQLRRKEWDVEAELKQKALGGNVSILGFGS